MRRQQKRVPSLSHALRYAELNRNYFDPSSPMVKNYLSFVNSNLAQTQRVVVVGCGVAGAVIAILLAQRGFTVTVFEQDPAPKPRPDDQASGSGGGRAKSDQTPREKGRQGEGGKEKEGQGRGQGQGEEEEEGDTDGDVEEGGGSLAPDPEPPLRHDGPLAAATAHGGQGSHTITLTQRGLSVLEYAGVTLPDNLTTPVAFNASPSWWRWWRGAGVAREHITDCGMVRVDKGALVGHLRAHLLEHFGDRVKVHHGCRLVGVKLRSPSQERHEAEFVRSVGRELKVSQHFAVPFGLLVGCDGVLSKVRDALASSVGTGVAAAVVDQSPLRFACFVIDLPSRVADALDITPNDTLTFPRGDARLVVSGTAHPSKFEAVLYLLEDTVVRMDEPPRAHVVASLRRLFPRFFAAVVRACPRAFDAAPVREVSEMCTVRCATIGHGPIALLGDAAGAIHPMLPQGCNAALEDCAVLDQALQHSPSVEEASRTFNKWRLEDRRALSRLADEVLNESPSLSAALAFTQRWCWCCYRQSSRDMLLGSFSSFSAVVQRHYAERKRFSVFVALGISAVMAGVLCLCLLLTDEAVRL